MDPIHTVDCPLSANAVGITTSDDYQPARLNTLYAAGNTPVEPPRPAVGKKSAMLNDFFRRGDLISFNRLIDLSTAQEIHAALPPLGQVIAETLNDYFALSPPENDATERGTSQDGNRLKTWTTLHWQYVDLFNLIIHHARIDHRRLSIATLKLILLFLSQQQSVPETIKKLLDIDDIRHDYCLMVTALKYSVDSRATAEPRVDGIPGL